MQYSSCKAIIYGIFSRDYFTFFSLNVRAKVRKTKETLMSVISHREKNTKSKITSMKRRREQKETMSQTMHMSSPSAMIQRKKSTKSKITSMKRTREQKETMSQTMHMSSPSAMIQRKKSFQKSLSLINYEHRRGVLIHLLPKKNL